MENSLARFIRSEIDQKLLDTHTSFLASVVSIDKNVMTVQPLFMYKEYGEKAKKPAVITNIPILTLEKTVIYIDAETKEVISIETEDIATGDTVLCVCCERNISEARDGKLNTPPVGHHNISDCVMTGALVKLVEVGGDD